MHRTDPNPRPVTVNTAPTGGPGAPAKVGHLPRSVKAQACYKLWRSRGAEFITEPKDKYGETRCYIRDPDGYIIEVGQSKPGFTFG